MLGYRSSHAFDGSFNRAAIGLSNTRSSVREVAEVLGCACSGFSE